MAETPYTVEQHIALKRVSAIAPSPDGTWLAVLYSGSIARGQVCIRHLEGADRR